MSNEKAVDLPRLCSHTHRRVNSTDRDSLRFSSWRCSSGPTQVRALLNACQKSVRATLH
jgi:hypothetical protein